VIRVVELDDKGLGYFTQFESVTRVMPSDYLETAGSSSWSTCRTWARP